MRIRLALLSLIFILSLVLPAYAQSTVLDRIVAVVNNDVITWLELYNAMENEMAPKLKDLSPEQRKQMLAKAEEQFLDNMVLKLVQMQEAKRRRVGLTEAELESTINNIRQKYGMSRQKFQQTVEAGGTEWEYYKRNLSDQIVLRKLVDREVRASMGDVLSNSQKSKGASYHLRQIFINLAADDETLKNKVAAIYQALEAGDTFESVAVSQSEGPNADSGGDLGVMDASVLSDEMREVISAMSEGDVSNPVNSARGLHIIKLERRVSGAEKDAEDKFEALYDKWLKSLLTKAHIDIRL